MTNKIQFAFLTGVFSIFILINSINAQVKNSIYSMFGVGGVVENNYGVNKALGGTGIAFQSGINMNYLNPASYLGIPPNSFNMEVGAYGIFNRSEDKNISQSDGNVNFSYLSFSLYVTKRWAAILGIVPFSSIDYQISSSDQIGGELISFEKNYQGTGGLSQVYLGNSFGIVRGLTVGFNASCIFGHITQTETALSRDNFSGYELKDHCTTYCLYLDYGMQYSVHHSDWLYTIGIIYGANQKLNSTNELDFTYEETTISLKPDEVADITIPQKFGFGLAAKKGYNFRVGFDYEWKNWASVNFSNPNLDTRNSNRYSIGIEYSPEKGDNLFKSLFYRAGINYKNSYLEIDNVPINSWGISYGIGIPHTYKFSNFNIAIEYGEEGTLNKGLIKNNYWMFHLNFSLHEFWASRKYM